MCIFYNKFYTTKQNGTIGYSNILCYLFLMYNKYLIKKVSLVLSVSFFVDVIRYDSTNRRRLWSSGSIWKAEHGGPSLDWGAGLVNDENLRNSVFIIGSSLSVSEIGLIISCLLPITVDE